MSREYVENRIKQALQKANGNALKARQQIIAWCYEDAKLLQILTKAHLNGIVAYNIERILAGRGAAKSESPAPKPIVAENAFGKEILRAVAGDNGAMFGLEGQAGGLARRGKASQQHVDALRMMAARSKTSKK